MRVVVFIAAALVALTAVGGGVASDSVQAQETQSEHLWSSYPQRLFGDVRGDGANLVVEIRDITGSIRVDGSDATIYYEVTINGWNGFDREPISVQLTPTPTCTETRASGLVKFVCTGIDLPADTDAIVVGVAATYGRGRTSCYPGPSVAYMSWTGSTWATHPDNRQHDPPDVGAGSKSNQQQVRNAVTGAGMVWHDNIQTHHIGLRILNGDLSAVPPRDTKPSGAKECTGGEACNPISYY